MIVQHSDRYSINMIVVQYIIFLGTASLPVRQYRLLTCMPHNDYPAEEFLGLRRTCLVGARGCGNVTRATPRMLFKYKYWRQRLFLSVFFSIFYYWCPLFSFPIIFVVVLVCFSSRNPLGLTVISYQYLFFFVFCLVFVVLPVVFAHE